MPIDLSLLITSLHDPRRVARALMDQRFALPIAAMMLALVVVLTSGLTSLTFMLFPTEVPKEWIPIISNPMKLALLQGLMLLVTAMLATGVGQMFKGQGRFEDAVILLTWVEFLMLFLQVAQTFLLLILPALADALGVFGLVIMLWMLCNFMAELHGFKSAIMVFGGMLLTLAVLSFAGALVVALISNAGAQHV